ncbi:hypothetical protein F66182_10467 [Fusarium sp. NRRL 66182]|nr:hypothetical protein F66182_10467 [Fusarium sp. NRRL 66182]
MCDFTQGQRHGFDRDPPRQGRYLLPPEELEKRHGYAKTIEAEIKKGWLVEAEFRLRAEHVAAILTLPPRVFQPTGRLCTESYEYGGIVRSGTSCYDLEERLNRITPFCKRYLQLLGYPQVNEPTSGRQSGQACESLLERHDQHSTTSPAAMANLDAGDGADKQEACTKTGSKPKARKRNDHRRDRAEEAQCLSRDGYACVMMGTANPVACHIFPFAWNDTEEHIQQLRNLWLGGCTMLEFKAYELVRPDKLGATDKVWNMLCLDPELQMLWARGYCAFKCIGIEPVGKKEAKVILEFRWMPQTKMRFGQQMDIHGPGMRNDWNAIIEEMNLFHESGNKPPVPRDEETRVALAHCASLVSGHRVNIQMKTEDASRFKEMIEMQWMCILMAALSGAVGRPELLSNNDPDDPVMQWLQDQARWAEQE